jgi:hypothetical protein
VGEQSTFLAAILEELVGSRLRDEFYDSTPADVLDRYTKTIDADDRTLVRPIENAVRNGTIQKLATGTLDPGVLAKTMQDFKNAVAAVVRLGCRPGCARRSCDWRRPGRIWCTSKNCSD